MLKFLEEKGLKEGDEVELFLLKMKGRVVGIDPRDKSTPIKIEREDGQIFPYSPYDIYPDFEWKQKSPISNSKKKSK
jgi:hypothetical protein